MYICMYKQDQYIFGPSSLSYLSAHACKYPEHVFKYLASWKNTVWVTNFLKQTNDSRYCWKMAKMYEKKSNLAIVKGAHIQCL